MSSDGSPEFAHLPEFSHLIDVRGITADPVLLVADEAQRSALAKRFGIVAVNRFEAAIALYREGAEVAAQGRISADVVQACAISGDDLAVAIDEPIALRFVPEKPIDAAPDEEIELTAEELDEIEYSGSSFDLGEAAAQSLGLAIDPYLAGPGAEVARQRHGLAGEERSGPLAAALAALKRQD